MMKKQTKRQIKLAKARRLLAAQIREQEAANKKTVIRLKMKNLSYLSRHPDRRLVKIAYENGCYYPPQILAIKHPMIRAEAQQLFDELSSALKLQRKYKRNHMQKEPALLKISKALGIFPESYVDTSPEVKEWEKRWEQLRREKLARQAAWHAARNKRKRKNYAVVLKKECEAALANKASVHQSVEQLARNHSWRPTTKELKVPTMSTAAAKALAKMLA